MSESGSNLYYDLASVGVRIEIRRRAGFEAYLLIGLGVADAVSPIRLWGPTTKLREAGDIRGQLQGPLNREASMSNVGGIFQLAANPERGALRQPARRLYRGRDKCGRTRVSGDVLGV